MLEPFMIVFTFLLVATAVGFCGYCGVRLAMKVFKGK
jgi:hypothetical protein